MKRGHTEERNVRPRRLLLFCIALMIPAAPASAALPHTVQPGETLWSIAASNNLTTRTVAAYNGLSEDSPVYTGETVEVPTVAEGAAALASSGAASSSSGTAASTTAAASTQAAAPTATVTPPPLESPP